MRTVTHKFLAKQLYPLLPASLALRRAFMIGCIEPDINLFSHLTQQHTMSAMQNGRFRGHNHPHLNKKIARLIKKLACPKRNRRTVAYAFQLGVLVHYLADAFTYVHSTRFMGPFEKHIEYEIAFHHFFINRMKHSPFPKRSDLLQFDYTALRREYLKEKPSFHTDYLFILRAVCSAMFAFAAQNALLPHHRSRSG